MPRQELKPGRPGKFSEPKWNEKRKVWQQSCLIGEPIGPPSRVWASGKTKPKCTTALDDRIADWKPRAQGIGVYGDDCTVLEAARAWLISQERNPKARAQTVDAYRREIEVSTGPGAKRDKVVLATTDLGKMRAADVKPVHVRVYLEKLNAHATKQGRHKSLLSKAFEMLVEDGLVDANPVASVRGRRGELAEPRQRATESTPWLEGEPMPFTAEQFAQYRQLEADYFAPGVRRDRRYLDFVTIAYELAARPGEALALLWSDVDLEAATAEITGTIVRTRTTVGEVRALANRYRLADADIVVRDGWRSLPDDELVRVTFRQPQPKTKESRRLIALGTDALAVLRRRKLAATPGQRLVFPARTGGPSVPGTAATVWRAIVADTELSWSTPRTLRSTRATRVAEQYGVPAAREMLGHEEGSPITKKHYVSVLPIVDYADAR
ncbi:site-specific integrase [Nocardia aurea]|uniref:site-specific integrase n=1 Tax=Nocardia aurea TaxID=2144174 RepID=UPI0033AF40F6